MQPGGVSELYLGRVAGPRIDLATDAVPAALAYRAQAPVLDGLMKELGLDGSSLGGLAAGVAAAASGPAMAGDVSELLTNQRKTAKPKKDSEEKGDGAGAAN